jgi:predicted GIY-YIG superfamily endonuclease
MKKYYCYLLTDEFNNTYIGITNNLTKRLRQHNGEISGGAKYTTRSNSWKYDTVIGHFKTLSKVLRFEWYWKHRLNGNNKWVRNKSGMDQKIKRLNELLTQDEWKNKQIIQNTELIK